jgi:ribosomal protein S18 acetylase RimI-like enzyme
VPGVKTLQHRFTRKAFGTTLRYIVQNSNNMITDLQIFQATKADELEQARILFREYEISLDFELDFQDFETELASLPGKYGPPSGRLLLARIHGQSTGCVGLRKLFHKTCEMKRLYVKDTFKGMGIGRVLAETVIEEACAIGYTHIRLDTVPSMNRARSLYESLGFMQIEPYCNNPIPGAIFLELDLLTWSSRVESDSRVKHHQKNKIELPS